MKKKEVVNRWDYLDDWVNLLFSEIPVYRVVNFQPSPLTSGRGFIISIDWVAWSYPFMSFMKKLRGEGRRTGDTVGIHTRQAGDGAAFDPFREEIDISIGSFEC